MPKLRIAHVTSELSPLARTGGLGDAVGSMIRAQEAAGHKVVAFLPYYREVRLLGAVTPQVVLANLPVHLAPGLRQEVNVLSAHLPGSKVPVYLVENAKAYDRDQLYGTPEGDYPDNAERFILLCRSALQAIKEMKEEFDVVHAHDWQASLVPAYLRRVYDGDAAFATTACVYSIHNLAYQGVFPKDTILKTGLGWSVYTPDQLEFYGKVNFMKAGILYADRITTVSPTYAKEILTAEYGWGLEGLLKTREADLSGVLNGIDVAEWDPAKDTHLAATFSRRNMAGKAACREALVKEFELPEPKGRSMLVAMVARLAGQKGFELMVEALPKLAKKPVQIAVLGSGERRIQDLLEDAARKYPATLALRLRVDGALAHRLYAGADAFLMPSRYEPCGLGQMIALRYGTLPIARATGGLLDTVTPVDFKKKQGTGFLFKAATADSLAKGVDEALQAFADEELWKKLSGEAMGEDFSWASSVKRYDACYTSAMQRRSKRPRAA
ncbi:MAG: glycogen synthase GlgA [Candidatus Coatesbacteria bacterium]